MDYDVSIKGSDAPADCYSPRPLDYEVISIPILPCIFASKCVAGLFKDEIVAYYLLPRFGIVYSFMNPTF
jgi:hypothetical protein